MDGQVAAEIAALPSIQALPLKRRFFALAYIRSQNGSQAVREAGFKPDASPASKGGQVSSTASRLLRDNSVSLAVREGLTLKWRALQMGPDEVLARAARIARHDHRKVIEEASTKRDLRDLDDDTAEALQGVKIRREIDKHGNVKAETVEYKVASKLGAIELLAKYHRLLQPDQTAGDFGASFAEAMERAGRKASLRDSAAGAEDAIINPTQSDQQGLPSEAAEQFIEGGTR